MVHKLIRCLMIFMVVGLPLLAEAEALRPTAHISTQTTTVLVAGIAGKTIEMNLGLICVDANGATTGITLQDTTGVNLIGTNVVLVMSAGQCFGFGRSGDPFFTVVTTGRGLNIVTTVGNGPVEVYMEVTQR